MNRTCVVLSTAPQAGAAVCTVPVTPYPCSCIFRWIALTNAAKNDSLSAAQEAFQAFCAELVNMELQVCTREWTTGCATGCKCYIT